jgi:hypothetical protein
MSSASKRFRDGAAQHLRKSRKKGISSQSKTNSVTLSASHKTLANNEEWLEGEKSRSKQRLVKVR